MPIFNSQQLISELQQQTEQIILKAVVEWRTQPSQIMLYQQSTAQWSATQCMMHLNSYGDFYLPALQRSIQTAVKKQWLPKETFAATLIGNWFTNLMLPKGDAKTVTKMKSPKNHTPQINENSEEVLARFIQQQETLMQLLDEAREIDLRKASTPISISRFISLPVGDTFRFLIAHNQRHVLQAERAIAAAKAMVVAAA